jgi:hypothetical protein
MLYRNFIIKLLLKPYCVHNRNNHMKKVLFAFVIGISTPSFSQVYHGDPEVWFLLLNNHHFNEQWSVGNELHIRRTDGISDMKQFILRPFVNFKPGENAVYSVGYSFIKTHPYGSFPLDDIKPEHNFWEQVTLSQHLGKTSISHRYRIEHRYQGVFVEPSPGEFEVDRYDFSHRFRYRFTLKQPITEDYFFNGFNELWISMDKRIKTGNLSQNWLYLGLGREIKNGNVQIAYLRQHSTGTPVEKHSTLQFTVQYDF